MITATMTQPITLRQVNFRAGVPTAKPLFKPLAAPKKAQQTAIPGCVSDAPDYPLDRSCQDCQQWQDEPDGLEWVGFEGKWLCDGCATVVWLAVDRDGKQTLFR